MIDDTTAEVLFNAKAVQAMLALMSIFTFVMWLCTLKMNATISLLFFLLMSTFCLLAGGVENDTVDKAAGWVGMATAATAYWLGAAELINDVIGGGHDTIPLGRFQSNRYMFSGAIHVPGRTQSEGQRQALKGTKMKHLRRSSATYGKGEYPAEEEMLPEDIDIEAGRASFSESKQR